MFENDIFAFPSHSNMLKIISIFVLFACCSIDSSAQNNPDSLSKNVRVVRDYKLDLLQERFNKTDKIRGFRVQIHSGLRKEEARKIKSKFLVEHPDVKCYESYQQPYFNVKAGDFLTKLDAQHFLNELRESFPNSFIVPETIQPKNILLKNPRKKD